MKMPDRMRLGPADAEDTWAESYETPEARPYNVIAESIGRRRISVYEALDGLELHRPNPPAAQRGRG
jgi:hypothetical protein